MGTKASVGATIEKRKAKSICWHQGASKHNGKRGHDDTLGKLSLITRLIHVKRSLGLLR